MTTQKRKLSEFAEPGMGGPEMGVSVAGAENAAAQHDNEGAMAKADLYKLASYAHKLYQQIEGEQQLEAWVQAKITKAADYIASVYHYLEYEMKFSEYGHHLDNSDTLSESQKQALRAKLNEAKDMVRQIKITQAEKVASKTELHEGHGTMPCAECDGTGVVQKPERDWSAVPQSVKDKFRKHDLETRAHHAAMKRIDAEEGAAEKGEEEEEVSEATKTLTTWTDKSGKKHPATSVKGDKYKGDEAEKEAKQKKVDEASEKTPTTWTDKSGKKHPATSVKGDKYKGDEAEKEAKGKKVSEATKTPTTWTDKSGKKHPATSVKGDKYKGDEAEKEAKGKKVDEASKPSAGLSKAKKSAVVKKAKAGGDIGKPGKNFDKVAKAAGGGEKGEKIAAAAMWKNIKETTAYVMEKAAEAKKADKDYDKDGKVETGAEEHAGAVDNAIKASKKAVKESTDFTRMQDQLARLNRSESHVLKESSEADQIRALTKRLLG